MVPESEERQSMLQQTGLYEFLAHFAMSDSEIKHDFRTAKSLEELIYLLKTHIPKGQHALQDYKSDVNVIRELLGLAPFQDDSSEEK